jgi:FdhE protein
MTRILAPGEIESSAQRTIPRIRLPDRTSLFAARAQRLRQLGEPGATGQAIGDYLRLMVAVAEAQHVALTTFEPPLPTGAQLAESRTHGMPLICATSWLRVSSWRGLLEQLCRAAVADASAPENAREVCRRLIASSPDAIEAQAEALLAMRRDTVDIAAAPFLMAALQIYWVALASRLAPNEVTEIGVPEVCPVCGAPPVASIVRVDSHSQGYRYLHCGLCATEWHLVRVTCSHCQSTEGISYHSIEGSSTAVRAEACDRCLTYRKILYQEKDSGVEPVADDLANLALDVLMAEAGYDRASGNPLLWLVLPHGY